MTFRMRHFRSLRLFVWIIKWGLNNYRWKNILLQVMLRLSVMNGTWFSCSLFSFTKPTPTQWLKHQPKLWRLWKVLYYSPLLVMLIILMLLTPQIKFILPSFSNEKPKAVCMAWYHHAKVRKCSLMICVNRPFNNFCIKTRGSPRPIHPCSSLRPPLHPLVHPASILALISTPIPMLFREHRDCLMIYWPDLPICTVNHNGPATKEEPAGLTPLLCAPTQLAPSHLLCNQPLCSLVPRVTLQRD